MTRRTASLFFSIVAILVGCGEGRLPDSVLWIHDEAGFHLSATKAGDLFVSNQRKGVKKFSGQSGALLWENLRLKDLIVQMKATESGDIAVMYLVEESLQLVLLSGDNGGELWSQSIPAPLGNQNLFENNRMDVVGNLLVFGAVDSTYLFTLDGELQWNTPLADGHFGAGAIAFTTDAGDFVRWEAVGQSPYFQYVLQGYDGAGSRTWLLETTITPIPNEFRPSFTGKLARSEDVVIASRQFQRELQVGEYVLRQTSPSRSTSTGIFALNSEAMVLWAQELPISDVHLDRGSDGVTLVAGNTFYGLDVDGLGRNIDENLGVLLSLDTISGKVLSLLSFFNPIRELSSDGQGRSYVRLEPEFDHDFLVGFER